MLTISQEIREALLDALENDIDEYIRLDETQPTPVAADSSICPSCGHIDGYHPPECMAGE